jgi:hypothetical protein
MAFRHSPDVLHVSAWVGRSGIASLSDLVSSESNGVPYRMVESLQADWGFGLG